MAETGIDPGRQANNSMTSPTLQPENLAQLVLHVRSEKVMVDADLAELYGVPTNALNQAVKRNAERFPADFMFQLTREEWERMRSQTVTASRRNIGAMPYAFTEQGVAMLSSVLRSQRAVEVNIAIMRTFVQLRRLMDSNRDLGPPLRCPGVPLRRAVLGGVRRHQTTHRRRRPAQDQTPDRLPLTGNNPARPPDTPTHLGHRRGTPASMPQPENA